MRGPGNRSRHSIVARMAFALAVALGLGVPSLAAENDATRVEFNRDIRPILSNHCFKCHGPAVHEAELRLDTLAGATAQLPSGSKAIAPGNVDASSLIARLTSQDPDVRMPPSAEAPALGQQQIETLRRWIAQGAEYQKHWAYLPPVAGEALQVQLADWPRNAIDSFVLSELERAGLRPSPEASRVMLIRRVSLDLTGLPPTPAEVRDFEQDASPDAYERLVDRLLASPQYGVRQALGWLDLARYADSDGYPHDGDRVVWPYRDWVVDAFNADMPYDIFTVKQLAGDLLPDATDADRVASAFHRQTRINREAGVDPEEFRLEAVLDRVNTTATVWMGATLGCAQCHDHKYDPFTQRDYYRLLAFFNNCADETSTDDAGRISDVSPRMPWLAPQVVARQHQLEEQLAAATDDKQRDELNAQLRGITPVKMLVMRELDQPRTTHIFLRGSFLSPGDEVSPGTPAVFDTLPAAAGVNRLALARWLVDPQNPLTARVAMNRLWAQYFGAGLVETLDDLGTQAPLCSHPQLLDWLAIEFVRQGWHFKPLIRQIVTSATYRQSAETHPENREHDPANRLLSRGPRLRLPAEIVRDSALAAAGLLSLDLGGPPLTADKMGLAKEQSPYRRSIYLRWKRLTLDDMLASFDAPSRDVTCARRTRTNTPLQSLALLNDRVFLDAARGLAERSAREAGDDFANRLSFAFCAVTARQLDEAEQKALTGLFERRRQAFIEDRQQAVALLRDDDASLSAEQFADRAAWVLLANTILNLNEAITRE